MSRLANLLDRPEYVHAAINHLPLVGLLVAMLSLICALALKERRAQWAGLALVGLLSLSAWPVYHYGEEGYDRVLSMSDEAGGNHLERHKALAERWIFLYYLTAGAAAVGLALASKWPRLLLWSSMITLALAAASLVAGILIAQEGGEIRHREFRVEMTRQAGLVGRV